MSTEATPYVARLQPAAEKSQQAICLKRRQIAPPARNIEASTSTDEQLMTHVRQGDESALGSLFQRYARVVHAVAYRILRDDAETDDLVQDVFVYIMRKASLFDPAMGSARSWIVQVTYHRAIDRRRYLISHRFYARLDLDSIEAMERDPRLDIPLYEQTLEGIFGKPMEEKMLQTLTEDQHRTLQLHFFEGETFEEIAAKMNQSYGNIRNHYYRGLEKIRKLLGKKKTRDK